MSARVGTEEQILNTFAIQIKDTKFTSNFPTANELLISLVSIFKWKQSLFPILPTTGKQHWNEIRSIIFLCCSDYLSDVSHTNSVNQTSPEFHTLSQPLLSSPHVDPLSQARWDWWRDVKEVLKRWLESLADSLELVFLQNLWGLLLSNFSGMFNSPHPFPESLWRGHGGLWHPWRALPN